jgi:hypothetical protein
MATQTKKELIELTIEQGERLQNLLSEFCEENNINTNRDMDFIDETFYYEIVTDIENTLNYLKNKEV